MSDPVFDPVLSFNIRVVVVAAHDAYCIFIFCLCSLKHFNNVAILVIHVPVWSVGKLGLRPLNGLGFMAGN